MGGVPKSNLAEGDVAPDFTVDSTGGEFNLYTELGKGPIMLLFYMGDFGTMCTGVILRFKELHPRIEEHGLRLFAINTNKVGLHVRFRGKEQLPFHLLSDVDGEVSAAYGPIVSGTGVWDGFSSRGLFIIDEDRVVRTQWVPEEATKAPDYAWVMSEVERFSRERGSD